MRFVLCLLIALLCTTPAKAENSREAWEKAESEAMAAWEKLPLTQRNIAFVSGEPRGFGMYDVRQSTVFRPDEHLVTYAETIGYGWKELPNGLYEIGIVGDFTLKDDKGEVIVEKSGFSRATVQAHSKAREFFIHYTLDLTNAPEGNYRLTYTLHDMASGESTSFDQAFTIRN